MAAVDGQTLSGQSAQTQSDFQSVYGSNADAAWEAQHNAAIAPAAATPTPTATSTPNAATTNTTTGAATPTTSNPSDLSALQNFFAQTSGVTQAQLAQQKAEFDAQMAFQEKQMQQLGIPQLQINQYLANLQQQQFQAQVAQAQASLTGYYAPPQFAPLSLASPTATGIGGTPGGGADQQQAYLSARTAQLQQVANMSATQAQQTAQSEWSQGLAQSGNVAYGLPQGYAAGGGATAAGGPTLQQYIAARSAQLEQIAGMSADQAQQTAQAEWSQGFAQSGNVAGGLPSGISFTTPTATTAQTTAGQPAGSQQTLALGQLLGTFNGQQTEAAREFAQQQALAAQNQAFQQALAAANLNLQQGQLGQQYLSTAASLQGPQNTFQLSNYLRGAQANPQVPTYLSALASNLGLPSFQATGSTAPTPASAGGLGSQLSNASSATPGWDYGSTIDTINRIQAQGAQSLAPGTLERLTPDELQAFGSGLGAIGGSLPSFLQSYQASRVGQAAPTGVPRLV